MDRVARLFLVIFIRIITIEPQNVYGQPKTSELIQYQHGMEYVVQFPFLQVWRLIAEHYEDGELQERDSDLDWYDP